MGTSTGYGLPKSGNWPDTKRNVTEWGKIGTSTPTQIGKVASNYVHANGGAASAAQKATAANRAGARLGGLLSGIRSDGLGPALENAGLGHLIGRPASEVIRGIRDFLTGTGSSLDDELVQEAFENFQEEIIGQCETFEELDATLSRLAVVDTISESLERFFGYFVYKKFSRDFSERLLKIAGGIRQANRLLRDIKDYVFDMIRTKLHGRDLNQVDWQGQERLQMTEEIHASVWRVFGEG
ncbi:MAG: hypothetical protein FOGNACKC_02930 [Anaerolineae bacterium]|nr:hypothetical protein [Anaerolineae bacterium]